MRISNGPGEISLHPGRRRPSDRALLSNGPPGLRHRRDFDALVDARFVRAVTHPSCRRATLASARLRASPCTRRRSPREHASAGASPAMPRRSARVALRRQPHRTRATGTLHDRFLLRRCAGTRGRRGLKLHVVKCSLRPPRRVFRFGDRAGRSRSSRGAGVSSPAGEFRGVCPSRGVLRRM
jgi:hypothetical protein